MEHWVEEVVPEAVKAASEHAGGRPVHLVGWSLGGIFALLAAADRPDLPIASLTVVGSPVDVKQVPMVAPLRPILRLTDGGIVTQAYRIIGGAPQPLTTEQRNLIGAVATVMGIGVKNMQLFLQTRELSLRDSLTGCFNRGYVIEALDAELHRSRRTGAPLSILMFDVDHFKAVNDRLGHLRGDDLLSAIGEQLGRSLRTSDIRCRYGGDEFLVVLPDTPTLGAQKVADLLRQDLAKVTVGADANRMAVTVSIGVAAAIPGELDAKALIQRADEAMYRAKRAGRNRLCLVMPPLFPDTPPGRRAISQSEALPRATARSASFG